MWSAETGTVLGPPNQSAVRTTKDIAMTGKVSLFFLPETAGRVVAIVLLLTAKDCWQSPRGFNLGIGCLVPEFADYLILLNRRDFLVVFVS